MYALKNAKNFTPHDVTLLLPGAAQKTFNFPSVGNCRAKSTERCAHIYSLESGAVLECGNWAGLHPKPSPYGRDFDQPDSDLVAVMRPPKWSGVDFVPHAPADGDAVIVSIVAAPALVEARPDLTIYVPDTGPDSAVRDEDGRIRAVKRIILWHDPRDGQELKIVQPFNAANPYDGWQLLRTFDETLDGLHEAMTVFIHHLTDEERKCAMLAFSKAQPIFIPENISEILTGWVGEVYRYKIVKPDHGPIRSSQENPS